MTIDPKKIREIARVCATLSNSAPTAEERDIFTNLALKWLRIALDRETRLALVWTVSTTTAVHQVSALPPKAQVSRRSPPGDGNRRTNGLREGGIRTVRLPRQRFRVLRISVACVAQ